MTTYELSTGDQIDPQIADLSLLLSDQRRDRLRAIRSLSTPLAPAAAFAIRRLLFTDRDAHVRAAAARVLGTLPASSPAESWLLDRATDVSPLVRDAIIRALARCGTAASAPTLRTFVAHDPVWWVRRAAIYGLAALPCGEAELATFTRALADPFWRVRHGAVRILSVLGARNPDVRDAVLDAPPSTTVAFLRGTWGPVAVEAPLRALAPSLLPPALLDPDPAVVTARVPHDREVTPLALVELLCDPHAALRDAVTRRLTVSGNLDALEASLDWLEEPRIPHVVDTVHDLLDRLGEPALAIAERALTRRDRPAATRWAIEWVVATNAETLFDAALSRALEPDADPTLRIAARSLATDEDLVTWATASPTADTPVDAAAPSLFDLCASELHARRAFTYLCALDGTEHPRTRALQIDAAARRSDPDWDRVTAGRFDLHHGPRAIAARWLVRRGRAHPAQFATDVDPTVREAALSAIVAEHGTTPIDAAIAGLDDSDPSVRRTAMRALVVATRHLFDDAADEGSRLEVVIAASIRAFAAPDPAIRRSACELPLVDDRLLVHAIACTGDRDEGVRAAAAEALERLPESDTRLRHLVDRQRTSATPSPIALTSHLVVLVYAWLLRRLDAAAIELARTAYDREDSPDVRTMLLGVIAAVAISNPNAPVIVLAHADAAARTTAPRNQLNDVATDDVTTIAASAVVAAVVDDAEALVDRGEPDASAITSDLKAPVGAQGAAVRHADSSGRSLSGAPDAAADRAAIERRPFGRAGFDVAPLAISGAFDLSCSGLEAAEAAGVDLFFWEPGYDLLGRFLRTRPKARVITGTYHADAASIRADVERACRTLNRDTIDVFLLFWTRSPARIDGAAYAVLHQLRLEGKLRAIGFSTHHRELAKEAIETRPWDVVMIRHSAAHPGIETELLPVARAERTAIVTFSALCYGRLTSGANAPTSAECYRYALAQPGVTACISAPRRIEELTENLGALRAPWLPAERIEELRTHGIGVRAESQRVNTLLRQPTRDAAAAAREMLASEPAPTREMQAPSPTAPRRSRARLGGRRRR